ncbi:hypothetical protein ACHQM5_012763 [Ranunculus cassubicifolius]
MSGLKVLVFFLVTLSPTLLIQHSVEGVKNLYYEEDKDLESRLLILNKKPIQTFKMEGDTYDCINVYKQPAFDHPLLKNHKIQMKPTYQPNLWNVRSSSIVNGSRTALQGVGCPSGTVPIRRTQKEELRRVEQFTYSYVADINSIANERTGQHIAILVPSSENLAYHGAKAFLPIEGLDIKENQYSTIQMWVESGSPEEYTSLQAGWMVSPRVGGDTKTRLFIYWTATGSKSGCYNQLCPGFVQVNQNFGLNLPYFPISKYGEQPYGFNFAIFQDNVTGDWWLSVGGTNVGYWPKDIIPQLGGGASAVAWGGLAGGLPNEDSPPMGNGYFPKGDHWKAGHVSGIVTLDASNKFIMPEESRIQTYVDNPTCYGIESNGLHKQGGLVYLFGGPGGKCGV